MTLLIALADDKVAILLADRRVSNGEIVLDDGYNKVTVFVCEDARLAVGFTGLATLGEFSTATWVTETLSKICESKLSIHSVLAEFEAQASAQFTALTASDRRVTFLFCGFVHGVGTSESRIYSVSNFEHGPHSPGAFITNALGGPGESIVRFAGATAQLPSTTNESLRKLLAANLKPSDIVRFAVQQVHNSSKSVRSIGQHCTGVIISGRVDTPIITTYHTPKNSTRAFGPNVVVPGSMTSFGVEIMASSILAGPEIRKQDPCWCGSGRAFKHCHMKKYGSVYIKHAAWRMPLSYIQRVDRGTPWLSGQYFLITSGYE